jgi:hypothetical protein
VFHNTASALFGAEGLRVTDVQAGPGGALEVWAVTDWPRAAPRVWSARMRRRNDHLASRWIAPSCAACSAPPGLVGCIVVPVTAVGGSRPRCVVCQGGGKIVEVPASSKSLKCRSCGGTAQGQHQATEEGTEVVGTFWCPELSWRQPSYRRRRGGHDGS